MNKFFISLVLFLPINIYSQNLKDVWHVGDIEIRGLKNIKPKLILKTVKAKKGKIYYGEDKKVDIENLVNLGNIDRVSIDIENIEGKVVDKKYYDIVTNTTSVKVIYTVVEKPYIKKLIIKGNNKISRSSIRSEMSNDEGDFFDELRIKEDIIKITEKYIDKGFINAKINYDVNIDSSTNNATLIINIKEGEKVNVRNVLIVGIKSFKEKKIIKLMKNRPKKTFQEKEFNNDFKEIENFYKNNGFANFKIETATWTISDEKYVDVIAYIDEGKKYKFGKTSFVGNVVYSSKELLETLEYRENSIFKDEDLRDTIRNIQEKYADKGYLRVEISTPSSIDDDRINIEYTIVENFPVYVRYIDIEGNKVTKTKVFKREIVQKEGDVFSLSKLRRSQEKIFNLGFIENVEPIINPGDRPDNVDIVFDITEGKPGMLTAGAGVSSRDGLVGMMSVSHMNMFGLANRLSLNWNFGKRVQDYSFSWTIPWVYDKPTSLGISLYNNRRFKSYSQTYSAYTEKRTGGSINVRPRFEDDKYSLGFGYQYEKIRIYDVDDIYKNQIIEGTSVQSTLSIDFTRDSRDYIWDPTRGTKFSISLDISGGIFGGDLDIYKPSVSYSYNKKLFSINNWPFVFSAATRFGWVKEFGSTKEVPVYERYFIGGSDTVRGYDSNGQIGPLDGGKVYSVTNFEFKFPLAREKKRTIVQWAFFLDIGGSWSSFDDLNLRIGRYNKNLKAGAGFGIRFTTPAFPIRLDWGYGFNHNPGESNSDIYFTIGNLF